MIDEGNFKKKRCELIFQVKLIGRLLLSTSRTLLLIKSMVIQFKTKFSSSDASDIEKVLPGKLDEVFTFLRDYKIPDGKPANTFAFDGQLKDKVTRKNVLKNAN
jgi:hypothetical protein